MTAINEFLLTSGEKANYNTKYGAEIYRRSMIVLLQCAISELYPSIRIQVGQTLMRGYFFELPSKDKLPEKFLENVTDRMKHIVSRKEKFLKKRLDEKEVIRLYTKHKRGDKIKAIKYLPYDTIDMIFLRDYFDYMLAECVDNTGFLQTFKLLKYRHGFILQFPVRGDMSKLPEDPDRQIKLYKIYQEAMDWNRILGICHVPDLNKAIENGGISTLIKVQEAFHEKKIGIIADNIKKLYPEKKIIFVAGPSASGKTTFLKRLAIQLRADGLIPEPIHLDDYFFPRQKTPVTPQGEKDFESIRAIDIDFFREQILSLLNGSEITLPKYNFKTGTREMRGQKLKFRPGCIIMVEGIHALNPKLLSSVADDLKYNIFVSALTQLCIDNDTRIFTSDSRLLENFSMFQQKSKI